MSGLLENVAAELERVVEHAADELRRRDDAAAGERPAPGRWSAKEIVGHLLDSAVNNHHRFIRAPQTGGAELVFPRYEQDAWVAQQDYQSAGWAGLVDLWRAYNHHLARVIRLIPPGALDTSCRIGPSDPVSLGFVVEDYLTHLKHHLRQLGIDAA
jgi:hypothetical protein